MNHAKVRGLLGLAARSGSVALGMENALNAARGGKALCLLMDGAAGPNTGKKLRDVCAFRALPLYVLPPGLLDAATGRQGRMAAALLGGSLSEEIIRKLTVEETGEQDGINAGVQANNG